MSFLAAIFVLLEMIESKCTAQLLRRSDKETDGSWRCQDRSSKSGGRQTFRIDVQHTYKHSTICTPYIGTEIVIAARIDRNGIHMIYQIDMLSGLLALLSLVYHVVQLYGFILLRTSMFQTRDHLLGTHHALPCMVFIHQSGVWPMHGQCQPTASCHRRHNRAYPAAGIMQELPGESHWLPTLLWPDKEV